MSAFAIVLMFLSFAAQARKKYYPPPKALLVKLSTETNRIGRLQSKQLSTAQLQADLQETIARTVMDFSDNFYYCPVYFFMDTNIQKICAGNFQGILLDKNLQPVQQAVLQDGDTGFFIGYYGPRISDFSGNDETEFYRYHNDLDTHIPRWVVMDHEFRTLRTPFPHAIAVHRAPYGRRLKQPYKAYVYNSRGFNIAYAPSALLYSATLEEFYRRHSKRK